MRALDLIIGTLLGKVEPARPPIPLQHVPGRRQALLVLREYVSELTFNRVGVGCRTIPFRVPREDFLPEVPSNVRDLRMPSIIVHAGDGEYDSFGNSPFALESTRDQFGAGTVLWVVGTYRETIQLGAWSEEALQRYAVVAGLMDALVAPVEERYGVVFRVPGYFGQTVRFTPMGFSVPDDPELAAHNRREGLVRLEMELPIVRLRHYVQLEPRAEATVTDSDGPTDVEFLLTVPTEGQEGGGTYATDPYGTDPWGGTP